MRQAERQQERHERHDQGKIGEPGRVRRDERRHGIEHQKDRECSQRGALRQREPRTENGAHGPDMPRLRGGLPLGRAKVGRPKDPQKSRLTSLSCWPMLTVAPP